MNEFIWIYIYTVLTNAVSFLWIVYLTVGLGLLMKYGKSALDADFEFMGDSEKEKHEALKSKIFLDAKKKIIWVPFVVLMSLSILVPSKDDIKTIIAGGLIWKAGSATAEIEGISDMPENIVNAMNAFLEGITDKKGE